MNPAPPNPTASPELSSVGGGTPSRVTFRRSAIRDAMRVTPARSPAPYDAVAELRHHHLAAQLTGVTVGDELLEVVADLHPYLTILDGQKDQQAVVLALLSDAATAVLEHLHGVLADVAVRLERVDRRHDNDVAAAPSAASGSARPSSPRFPDR